MFDELYAPLPSVDAYLGRIGYAGSRMPTRETLDGLVLAHLASVPFEDLDSFGRGIEPSLGITDLFDKVVERRRGGYCFELNGLFAALLRALGFEVMPVAARVTMDRGLPALPLHRGNIVMAEGERRWVDVGFGGPSPASSVVLAPGLVQRTPSGEFAFERAGGSAGDALWQLVAVDGQERRPTVAFVDRPVEEVDFVPLNWYTSGHPGSRFRDVRLVRILTAQGSRSIEGDVLRERAGGQTRERRLESRDELVAVLRESFGIEVADGTPC